jgi:carboxylesterase type B
MQLSKLLIVTSTVPLFGSASPDMVEIFGSPKLELDTGVAEGETLLLHGGIRAFYGLPFAKPPIADLRWQPPQPPVSWAPATRKATSYGKTCMQHHNAFVDFSKMSEDCLYLNVWLPKHAPAANTTGFPTLLFFYGGSWKEGSAMFPLYSGKELVAHHDVVAVAANYRLGALGYLGSDRLRAADGSTGNYGIQDQRAAMAWIHRNAHALGADTNRLMIFGESAGGGSVANHLVRPRSWGMFTRAGMESGPIATWTSQSLTDASAKFDMIAQRLGCGGPSAPSAAVQRCLRAVPAANLTADHGLPPSAAGRGILLWSPVVDGVELSAPTVELASAGKLAPHVPVLVGSNADEGSLLFSDLKPDANATDLRRVLTNLFRLDPYLSGAGFVDKALAVYPPSGYTAHDHGTSYWWAGIRGFGDLAMSCAARRTVRWVSNATLRGSERAEAYLYFMQRKLKLTSVAEATEHRPFGVFHGSELPIVFDSISILLDHAEKGLALDLMALWTGFADKGKPDRGERGVDAADLLSWPTYDAATDLALIVDTPLNVSAGLKKRECDFWDRVHGW